MKLTTKAQLVTHPQVKQCNLDANDTQDVYTRVTNKIIADLEKGNLTGFVRQGMINSLI